MFCKRDARNILIAIDSQLYDNVRQHQIETQRWLRDCEMFDILKSSYLFLMKTNHVTNSMELNLSHETKNCSGTQEIPNIYGT
jgi:hypothetical protein